MDANTFAAVCSAIAAAFSALAALLSWRVQVRQVRESVRPDLLLSGWIRENDPASGLDSIKFQFLSNVGRGHALKILLDAHARADDDRMTYGMGTARVPILEAGNQSNINGTIRLHWNAVPNLGHGQKMLPLDVSIRCLDSVGVHHVTTVTLTVFEDIGTVWGGASLAPGVGYMNRDVRSESVWWLQLRRRFGKLD